MKLREINEKPEWTFWVPDSIADWDAPSHWERERLASMEEHLRPGMVLYDIGVEHGWLSAVYGSFTGHGSMVLVEPSPEFWPNIRLTWETNHFAHPIACVQAFADEWCSTGGTDVWIGSWPECSVGDEIGAMAYRHLNTHEDIPSINIDMIGMMTNRWPDAITIDIEGAEYRALRGAKHALLGHRPLVWVSIHPDLMERDFYATPDDLREFMDDCAYDATHLGTDHEEHWLFTPRSL